MTQLPGTLAAHPRRQRQLLEEHHGPFNKVSRNPPSHILPPYSLTSLTALRDFSLPTVSTPPRTPLPFFHLIERLKTTPREGWRRFPDINRVESISDHMYRMSIITMLAPPSVTEGLDIPHCTKMALVHDMAESLVGDITPQDGVPKEEKMRRESDAMDYLCDTLLGAWGGGNQGQEIKRIFLEYEEGTTEESKFVHDVDKIELLLQMIEYERRGEGDVDLVEFLPTAERIRGEGVKAWAREILEERDMFWRDVHARRDSLGNDEAT